jgi:cell division protein ZapA
MSAEPVSVRILDREYTVGVGGDERDSLMAAARLLDARMREIRGSNRMAAVDRVAVLAALNLAHELQLLRDENARQAVALQQTLADLNRRLDRAIDGTPKKGTED